VCRGRGPFENIRHTHVQKPSTYCYPVLALKLVKASRLGLALIIRTTLLIGVVEDVRITVIDAFAGKDIGNEFQDRGLSNASLSNKKNSDCLIL